MYSCHKNLPIRYNNVSLFVEPIGRTITPVAAEIPCSKLASSIFQVQKNLWISAGKYYDRTEKPKVLKPQLHVNKMQFYPIKNFFTSGMYSRTQLQEFSEYIAHPMRAKSANEYLTSTIVKTHEPSENFKLTNLLSKEEIQKLTDNFLREADEKIMRFGAYFGAVSGVIMLFQAVSAIISMMINFKFLKATLGVGWHLAASVMTSLTNFVIRNNTKINDQDEEKGLQNTKPKQKETAGKRIPTPQPPEYQESQRN